MRFFAISRHRGVGELVHATVASNIIEFPSGSTRGRCGGEEEWCRAPAGPKRHNTCLFLAPLPPVLPCDLPNSCRNLRENAIFRHKAWNRDPSATAGKMNPVLGGILVLRFIRSANRGFISCNCGANLANRVVMQRGILRHMRNSRCFEASPELDAHIMAGRGH